MKSRSETEAVGVLAHCRERKPPVPVHRCSPRQLGVTWTNQTVVVRRRRTVPGENGHFSNKNQENGLFEEHTQNKNPQNTVLCGQKRTKIVFPSFRNDLF